MAVSRDDIGDRPGALGKANQAGDEARPSGPVGRPHRAKEQAAAERLGVLGVHPWGGEERREGRLRRGGAHHPLFPISMNQEVAQGARPVEARSTEVGVIG